MKKKVKSLIIAASVAAIAGIAAVSFAAWSGGAVTDQTAGGASGAINTDSGSISLTQNLVTTGDNQVKLVPWDQVAQFDNTTMAKMQTVEMEYVKGTGADASNYKFEVKLTANADNLVLYYQLGDVSEPTSDPTLDSSWTLLAKDTAIELTLTSNKAKVNVVLVSGSTDDMNKSYTLTFSATEITTADSAEAE